MPPLYVFDTNSFRVFGNYYPEVFGRFWDQLNACVDQGRLTSVREVRRELEAQNASEHLGVWIEEHQSIFYTPSEEEMHLVAAIFAVEHFRQLIGEKQRLRGLPVADPFIVARARVTGSCVVTEEALKPNAAKVPNVCEHFQVECINVQGFLNREGWRY